MAADQIRIKFLEIFREVKQLRSLALPSLRNAIIRDQIDCLLEHNADDYDVFLSNLDRVLSGLRTLSEANKLQKFHQERYKVDTLLSDFVKSAGLPFEFDKIVSQSIVDVYCGRMERRDLDSVPSTPTPAPSRSLTPVELNAIAYTSGYVIHKLYKEAKDTAVVEALAEMLECGQMAKEAVPSDDAAFFRMVTTYLGKADRGGLAWLPEPVIQLFCRIEDHAYAFAQHLFQSSLVGNNPPAQQHAIQGACNDDDIVTKWNSIVCLDKTKGRTLLEAIITKWLNLRVHSYVEQKMETYKLSMKITKKGLRKTLKSKHNSTE